MGDAILCTPALRAIRKQFKSAKITFFANKIVHEILTPNNFNDEWLIQNSNSPFSTAKVLKTHNFTHAILLKNSFGSALTTFLAGIDSRIGYARQGRGIFLTDKLYPPKNANGKYKPLSMIDYYMAAASWLGCDVGDRVPELQINAKDSNTLKEKMPNLFEGDKPLAIFVPGGAFGFSKCWPSERFAKTADRLSDDYNAEVVISVSPNPAERRIAQRICDLSKNKLTNLGEKPLTLSELKSLFSIAALIITNDTGPRHIAIALKRNVITLFGPNDPAWTNTGYENEIQIVGEAACAPCQKPKCIMKEHMCMLSITTEMVYDAAKKLLENK